MKLRLIIDIPIDKNSSGYKGMTDQEIADLTEQQLKDGEIFLDEFVDLENSLTVEVL